MNFFYLSEAAEAEQEASKSDQRGSVRWHELEEVTRDSRGVRSFEGELRLRRWSS